jgi:type I restriction enzyme S subunit
MRHKYSEYKSSGIEWIGEIPKHWVVKPLKYLIKNLDSGVSVNSENVPIESYLEYGVLKTSCVYGDVFRPEENKKVILEEYELAKCSVKKNSIIISRMNTPELVGSSAYVQEDFPNLFLPDRLWITIFNDSININVKWVSYILKSDRYKKLLSSRSTGTSSSMKNISKDDVLSMIIPFTPISEQLQIVNYLDEKTTQIDQLISITEKKIEGLKEKRTSLINHVVTKGLDSDVEMKDSGVEWIGEIPKHWEAIKMKYCLRLISEKGNTIETDIKISPENVESNTGVCFNLSSEYTGDGMKFQRGDILFNKLRIYLKKIVLAEYDGFSMGEMIVLRTLIGVNKFYYYTLFNQGLIDLLNEQSTGVKLPRVSPEIILNTEIVSPPLNEQEQIVKYIDSQTTEIDKLVSIEKKRIETLKEYRQSLISEVVTGKIRVCEEVSEVQEN